MRHLITSAACRPETRARNKKTERARNRLDIPSRNPEVIDFPCGLSLQVPMAVMASRSVIRGRFDLI
jgi:hypothetical protein